MKRLVKSSSVVVLLLLVSSFLSGCILVPFVQAFKASGVTEEDRKALLAPEVKKFSDAVAWGNRSEALGLVTAEARDEIVSQLKKVSEEEKVVDSKVEDVAWGGEAKTAEVSLKVRFYKVPFYIVKTRIEEQSWVFSLSDGWRLKSRSFADK